MGTATETLRAFASVLGDAVAPVTVFVQTGSSEHPGSAGVLVTPTALTRTGRRTDKHLAQLELELTVLVECVGDNPLDTLETLLVVFEGDGRYQTAPIETPLGDDEHRHLGLIVTMPVSIPIERTTGPRVLEPLDVRLSVREPAESSS